MNFRIHVTPATIADQSDQALVDTPHFVAYSKIPTNRDFDPAHHRIDTTDIIEFEQYNAALEYADYCSEMNRAHRYVVTCEAKHLPEAIQYLLSEDRTEDALAILSQHTDEAPLLRGRYNASKKQYNMGMIGVVDHQRSVGKIVADIVAAAQKVAE